MEGVGKHIIVNECRHYALNQSRSNRMFYLDCSRTVEVDLETSHPFGTVYRSKTCINSLVRFVRLTDKTIFMFSATEWQKKENPFYKKQTNE